MMHEIIISDIDISTASHVLRQIMLLCIEKHTVADTYTEN
jgi:hypothetical protein